jgi:hypothetical protein
MESHPEEFSMENGRWAQWLDQLVPFVTEAELRLLREPMMRDIHEEVLDELCNGEERRRKEREEQEYERHLAMAMQHTQRYPQGQLSQGSGGGGGAGIVGKSYTCAIMDEYDYDLDRYRNAVPTLYGDYGSATSALPVANGGTDNTIINQIKNMLKRGK